MQKYYNKDRKTGNNLCTFTKVAGQSCWRQEAPESAQAGIKTQEVVLRMKKCGRKLLSAALTAALTLSLAGGASAAFSDVDAGSWYSGAVSWAVDQGLVSGYSNGTFQPDAVTTRAEFAVMLNQILKLQPQGNASFSDVARDAWYYDAVTALAEAGLVDGSAFRPDEAITREEAAVLCAKALELQGGEGKEFTDGADISQEAQSYVQAMVSAGYMAGYPDGSFQPDGELTRAEAAQILSNASAVVEKKLDAPVEPIDMEEYLMKYAPVGNSGRALAIDRTETNEHPVTGYFTFTIPEMNRTVKLYVGEHSGLRNYITVIAVPNGVENTYEFLKEQGWIDQAEANGELLFVLEPGVGGWGTPEEEAAYLDACIGEVIGNTADGTRETTSGGMVQTGKFTLSDGTSCPVFTGHSCNYYVGYGEGCAVLESWTANNPIYVNAQAMIGGQSVGADYLNKVGERVYDGYNVSAAVPNGYPDDVFQATLDGIKEAGDMPSSDFITNKDVPVPTLFAGYDAEDDSVAYWRAANDATGAPDADGVYHQDKNSDAWSTAYANELAANWGSDYGISQVKLTQGTPSAQEIRDFLSDYTRYTYQFAYSNALSYRLDYYPATKAARTSAESGKVITTATFQGYNGTQETTELRALESIRVTAPVSGAQGTFYSCIYAFNDYDDNGVKDPRETIIYVPDSAKSFGGDGAPVVVIFPGNSQSAATFMDCSGWWQVANDKGCVIMIMGEYCVSSAASLTYSTEEDQAETSRAALALLENVVAPENGVKLDLTRVYGSGHSAGSGAIQAITHTTDAGYFAAVASTSFPNAYFTTDSRMPSYLFGGQSDNRRDDRDMSTDPWVPCSDDVIYNMHDWVVGAQKLNGIDAPFTDNDHDSFLASCSEYDETGRYFTYTWENEDGIPLVKFTRTQAREHNCYPEEFQLAWDYLSCFRLMDDGTRLYSPSGFTQDDTVEVQ